MEREALQPGDIAVFNSDFEADGENFPAGTECVIVAGDDPNAYQVEVLEPRHEIIMVPQAILDPVQP